MKKIVRATVLVLALLFILISAAQAQSPQQTLNQYVADLQKNPGDYALREKIIRHVQTMKPKPAIPEEARRHFIEGNTLLKAAKDQRGYGLARDAYRQCLLIAPWWADAYNNNAVALELSGQFDEAVNALKFYLATNPGESESRKAQDKIYEIGAKKKIATQEKEPSAPKAVSSQPQNTFEDLLRKIDGRRYFYSLSGQNGYAKTLDVSSRYILLGLVVPPGHAGRNHPGGHISYANRADGRYEIRGRETTVKIPYTDIPPMKEWAVEMTYIISENGDRITERALFNTGRVGNDMIYHWRQGLSQ